MNRPDTHVKEPLTDKNIFTSRKAGPVQLPDFASAKESLPDPIWENQSAVLKCYWKTWELAFSNLRNPSEGSRFISPFIDTAFNGNLFLWDSVFILMFGKYGRRGFDFQKTLDNFYSHQHSDGYICREIGESDSTEMFERFDPSSTGPNILAWSEWEYYLLSRNRKRLEEIFPPLLAYNRWFRKHRTWRDGSYWSSGWGCGMDNQPRLDQEYHQEFDHGFMAWADTTLQQILNNRILIEMAGILGRESQIKEELIEIQALKAYVNSKMWDCDKAFYFDVKRNGKRSDVKSIAAYWALLADVVKRDDLYPFLSHLENEREFNRPHRIPTLSADHSEYSSGGGYWKGGVWAPTNYMVLRGLSRCGRDDLAHRIGLNHLEQVVETFGETGTLWENYAPEYAGQGEMSRPDFVGWTGLSSISVLFEYVFGIRPGADSTLLWDIRLTEEHGVTNYPLGEGSVDLICRRRLCADDNPEVKIKSDLPVKVRIRWPKGEKVLISE